MGIWSKVRHGTRRLLLQRCPKCGTSDADVPDHRKIMVRLIKQTSRKELRWIGEEGDKFKYPEFYVVWEIREEFLCQQCGHKWKQLRRAGKPSLSEDKFEVPEHKFTRMKEWKKRWGKAFAALKTDESEKFQNLVDQLNDVTPFIYKTLRRSAAEALGKDGSPEAVRALVEAFLDHDDTELRRMILKILAGMAESGNGKAREALLFIIADRTQPLVRESLVTAECVLTEPFEKAIMFAILEKWEKYEQLAVPAESVRSVFMEYEEPLRELILDRLRKGKKIQDIFSMVDPDQYGDRITDGDWTALLAGLEAERRWERIWHLATTVPVSWSAKFLKTLYGASWRPPEPDDAALFSDIEELVRACCRKPVKRIEGLARGQAVLEGHTGAVDCLAVNHNGTILASGSSDSTIRLWGLPDGVMLHKFEGDWKGVSSIAMSRDGDRLAAISGDKIIRVWSLPDGSLLHEHEFARFNREPACLVMSPDGQYLAAGIGKDISVWSVEEGELLHTLDGDSHWGVLCLAAESENGILASGGWDKTVRLWDLAEGELLHTLESHDKEITGLAFGADGRILVAKSRDHAVGSWNLSEEEEPSATQNILPESADRSDCIALNPDGTILFCGCVMLENGARNGVVELWDTVDASLANLLEGHSGKVNCLAASAGGEILAGGGEDKTIRVWEFGRIDIRNLSVGQTSREDMQFVESLLDNRYLPSAKRRWLEFLLKFSTWYHKSENKK